MKLRFLIENLLDLNEPVYVVYAERNNTEKKDGHRVSIFHFHSRNIFLDVSFTFFRSTPRIIRYTFHKYNTTTKE